MGERISNSLRLARASWEVLRADRELVIFPIVSAIAAAILVALFAIPLWAVGFFDNIEESGSPGAASYVVLFLFYVVLYTIINFCNAALVGAALVRLRGGDPTAADGFRLAVRRLGPIVGYALIGATVGVVLQAIRERSGLLGNIIAGLIGMAWGLVTYLVVPVLVVEEIGPVESIKRSAALFRRTWGEQVIGNVGIGLVIGLVTFGAIMAGVVLVAIAAAIGGIVLAIIAGVPVVLAIAAIISVGAALKGIYTAALYRFAADDATSTFFPDDLIRNAFVPKS